VYGDDATVGAHRCLQLHGKKSPDVLRHATQKWNAYERHRAGRNPHRCL
jgi:hypothetical protein